MVACGGDDSMSVFMFKVLEPDTAVGATSRGCFEDTKRNRALDGPRESNRRHMDAEVSRVSPTVPHCLCSLRVFFLEHVQRSHILHLTVGN